jgi:hypothetical protein
VLVVTIAGACAADHLALVEFCDTKQAVVVRNYSFYEDEVNIIKGNQEPRRIHSK